MPATAESRTNAAVFRLTSSPERQGKGPCFLQQCWQPRATGRAHGTLQPSSLTPARHEAPLRRAGFHEARITQDCGYRDAAYLKLEIIATFPPGRYEMAHLHPH